MSKLEGLSEIGKSIQTSRKKLKMTQTEFGKKVGLSRKTIGKIESGESVPSEEKMTEIYNFLATKEEHEPLESIIDYLRISFPFHNVEKIFNEVLKIKKEFFVETSSHLYGYVGGYQLDYLQVLYSKKNDDRGILIQLSGQGCRQFEAFLGAQGRTWFDFFYACFDYRAKFTRVDLAINDYREYLKIPVLLNKIERQELISRFEVYEFNGSGSISKKKRGGVSIYLGSKKSLFYIAFYQKNYEQAKKLGIPVEDVPIKNRYELRFKDERAMDAITRYVESGMLSDLLLGILNDYLCFTDKRPDVSRKYWPVNKKWQHFIGGVENVKLVTEPNEKLYERSKNWFKRTVAPTVKMLLEVDDCNDTEETWEIIDEAELSDKHLHMIEVQTTSIQKMLVA
ncbi:helix-turn-helix domain-containing protein [Enterococcus durans]|uniref:Helix-turn-helix domain-containing protein n=1 Tax=Enterococcus durans TaxID=53345 RepID=A0A5N0YTT3_9ENTE|nr:MULTISPECIES: XRE family transcriptional regulator [Enterococcus]KAA9178920.1 helix-turn-helix domain-containing protein [Enterococcus durans]KAA9182322.1 helix-turn-helix domain-containing protein [Enterococcus durans]KAA9186665.1 helix-turn-helix domain-containing protein [Enterococcus durans]KAA9191470.1 helix-turn-helix domain-containing protein [Enterococcus durans]KAA9193539.1 helix-turn-helix domain-containing protein [Enterococcus durans]